LTPSARSANLIAGDGTKNGLPAPNKKLTANLKQPLDRKSPIQVKSELGPHRRASAHACGADVLHIAWAVARCTLRRGRRRLIQPKVLNEYLKTGLGRYLPELRHRFTPRSVQPTGRRRGTGSR